MKTQRPAKSLKSKVRKLLQHAEEEGISCLSPALSEPTIYTHPSQGRKVKGGSPPIEFSAVETKVDLERALEQEDWPAVATQYYRLRRLLNF